jgi:hypothetical protein
MVKGLFMQELQKGFHVPSRTGKSVHAFLTEDCGITSGYITDKIKTILIDGGPVDDIFNTVIKDGGTCAISGAMPGIAGAMMRIGSPYAAMRDSITARPGRSSEPGKKIMVELKLFNVVLSDMGPGFLKQGILTSRKRVYGLFKKHGDEIYPECRDILLNNAPVDMQKLTCEETGGLNEPVILKIETEDENNS